MRGVAGTSSKRRRPSPDSNEFGAVDQSNKRHRSDAPSSSAAITRIGLPSPAPSSSDSHEYSPSAPSNPLPIPCISNRKRRLSDADLETCHAPKRPCNLPVWPRPHAASGPLPLSAIDDWFHNNFGIPNAITVEAPDESVPVEVDIFDYSTINGAAL